MAAPSKNILWLSVSRVISLALLFLAYTQLFRYLGPESSGQFQFVLSFVTLFGVVIDFGIQQYVIKKISEDTTQAKKYFHNFLAVELLIVVLIYGAMVAVSYINGYEPVVRHAIMLAGLGAAVHGLVYPFLTVMTSFYDLKKVAWLNFLASLINVTVIFFVIWSGRGIVALVTQQLIYAICALILYYRFVQKYIGPPQIWRALTHPDFTLIKQILFAAIPFAVLVGFSTLYNRIDVVLITKFLGYTQTGLYTAAYKFFDLLSFFPAVVSHALYPLFASLMAKKDTLAVREILEKYLRFMAALAIPMATGAMLLAKPILHVLAGEEFAGASQVLAVIAWAPAILFLYIVVNSLMISQLTKFATIVTGVNVVINIVGNIILLPRYGIVAAAVMTLVSEGFQGIFYFYFVYKKITHFRFFQNLWQPILASALMGVVVYYLRDQFIAVPILAGGVVYVIALASLKFFRKTDWEFIMGLLRRGYEPS